MSNHLLELSIGPQGRSVIVDASGRLVATSDPVGGLFPYSFGNTGRALVVDASGMLVLSPLSNLVSAASGNFYQKNEDLIPLADEAFDIGSASFKFDTLHALSGRFYNGLQIGAGSVHINPDGTISTPITKIETAGTEKIRVTTSGNVGIGTTQPNALLHVAGTFLAPSGTFVNGLRVKDGGNGKSQFDGELAVKKTLYTPIDLLVSATGINVDLSRGNRFKLPLAHNATLSFSNPRGGAPYMFIIKQSVGSRTVTWPSNMRWRGGGTTPTLTAASGSFDVVSMVYEDTENPPFYLADAGTDWAFA